VYCLCLVDQALHVDTQTGLPASSSEATCMVVAIKIDCDWVVTAFNQAFLSAHALPEAADMDKQGEGKRKKVIAICGGHPEDNCNNVFVRKSIATQTMYSCLHSCCEAIPTEYLLA